MRPFARDVAPPIDREALLYVREHGHYTVDEFAAENGLDRWCTLFNRGLVAVISGTICLTPKGEEALSR